MTRFQTTFGMLILAQAAHCIEEYAGRLWTTFPPAQYLTGLISQDRRLGFIAVNVTFIVFGIWCFLWPVRKNWTLAIGLAWFWAVLELVNGTTHVLWSFLQQGYTAGSATAPVLLVLAFYLARLNLAAKR